MPHESRIGCCRVVVAGGWVHVSNTTGQDHEAGEVPPGVAEQCRLALLQTRAALAEAGTDFGQRVRVIYIPPDRDDFAFCRPQLRRAFGENPPAAAMIEAGLTDPAVQIKVTTHLAAARPP